MAGELFDRKAVLRVGEEGGAGLEIDEQFRIAFDIEKTIGSASNKATFQVYNLSADSRDRIREENQIVEFEAGHEGNIEQVYEGEVTQAFHQRDGPDRITTIECGDGVETFKAQTVQKEFSAGTRITAVIEAVALEFTKDIDDPTDAVRFGKITKKKKPSRLKARALASDLALLETTLVQEGFSAVLRKPFAVSGNAKEVMDGLARMWRFDWSVQDGVLQVVSYGRTLVASSFS